MNTSQLPNRRVFVASYSPYQIADYQDRAAEAVTSPRTPGSRHFDSGATMNEKRMDTKVRERVFKRDNYTCRYCGCKTGPFHADHVYPYSKGGETSINNLVTACERCNLKKSNKVGIFPFPIGYFEEREQIREEESEKVRGEIYETKQNATQILISLLFSSFYLGLMIILPLNGNFLFMRSVAFAWFGISIFYTVWWIVDIIRNG